MAVKMAATISKLALLPVATRHWRDTTEQLLKATFNKNKQIFQFIIWVIISPSDSDVP